MNQAFNDCLTGWNNLGKAFCSHAGSTFVQLALLVVLLLALDVLLRQRVRAVFRYYVWLLVLLKLVLPPTLSLPTGIGYWVGTPLPVAPAVPERLSLSLEQEHPEQDPPAPPQVSGTLPTIPRSTDATTPATPAAPAVVAPVSLTWQAIVLLLWSAGVLAFLALLTQRLRFIRGLIATSLPAERELLDVLGECARQMGIRRPVKLRTLDTLPSPAVCGLWRPTILMPALLIEKLSPEGLQTALLHELAHIKRADLWVNTVQTLLQIVYFYNPFVWLANAIIRRTCEEAVDETVLVTLGGRARNYSNTLIDISEMAFWKADFGLRLVGVAESKRLLQGRIKHMLTRPIPKSTRIGTFGAIMILVVAAVLLPMARGTQVSRSGPPTLMDRLQKEDDPELAELIRTAVANHKGASEKEILEITRRITLSRAQILLLDTQIEEVDRKIEANPGPGETREGLLRSKKELEAKRMAEMGSLREAMGIVPRRPLDKQPVDRLNAWLRLNAVEQGVYVTETLRKAFTEDWAEWSFKSVGLLSEQETLDYVRRRLQDQESLPIRLDVIQHLPWNGADEDLRGALVRLASETNNASQADVRLWRDTWTGPGTWTIFLRGGEMTTLYPRAVRRPDGRVGRLGTGRIDPNDLKQHVLWRLLHPGNAPLTARIEYDDASAALARQVADTVRATARELGIAELVQVAEALVEPTPEAAFLGRWRAIASGLVQAIEIQPKGLCVLTTGEGAGPIKPGTTVSCPWVPTTKEIIVDLKTRCFAYRAYLNAEGNLVVEYGDVWPQGGFHRGTPHDTVLQKVSPQSEPAKTALEPKPPTKTPSLPEPMDITPRSPFGELSTAQLNAWVRLQVLEQRVVVLDTLKPFDDQWFLLRHKVVGALSEKETLDYLRGRFQDKRSLPIRVHIYHTRAMKSASEDLGRQIFALAREANAERDTEVRLEPSVWVGSGESPFYLRAGQIRTFYPRPMPRPDGGPEPIASGLVAPSDLEQHILWRLSMPKNLPLTFRVEYDRASSALANQVVDTAQAVTKRVGLSDLVKVAGVLVESVPESAFLGQWQALGRGMIQSVDIQPGGICQALVGEGSRTLQPGTTVTGTWVWTAREIQLDINDPIPGTWEPLHYAYRATVNGEDNLVIEKGEIYPQGSFMHTRPPRMVLKKVQ